MDRQGYVQVKRMVEDKQVSITTMNHIAAVQTTRRAKLGLEQASHLCGRSVCFRPGHVVWESVQENNSRKGCQVWAEFAHSHVELGSVPCPKKVSLCTHSPLCLKAIPGVKFGDFMNNPGDYLDFVATIPCTLPPHWI